MMKFTIMGIFVGGYEIISVGGKLKALREKYNVRQEDLAGEEINGNLISQTDHGKIITLSW